MKNVISVILPVYNVEEYISDCLNSLLNQSYGEKNLEIILIDDCSTDNTNKIIEQYQDIFTDLKHIKLNKNNGSPGKPRNIGVAQSTGTYLYFMDPDDVIDEFALEMLKNNLQSNDDFSMGSMESFNEDGSVFQHITFSEYKLQKNYISTNIEDTPFFAQLKTGVVLKLIRKKFYINNNISFIENMRNGEDKYVDALLYSKAKSFTYIPYVVYRYRNRNVGDNLSLTHQEISGLLENDIKAYYLVENLYNKETLEYYKINVMRSIFWQLLSEDFFDLSYKKKIYFLKKIKKITKDYNQTIFKHYLINEEPIAFLLEENKFNLALEYSELLTSRKKYFFEGYDMSERIKWKEKYYKSNSYKLYSLLSRFRLVKGD